jgi:hypothetical protein
MTHTAGRIIAAVNLTIFLQVALLQYQTEKFSRKKHTSQHRVQIWRQAQRRSQVV